MSEVGICPVCGLEMRVIKATNRVANDTTPDAETKLYRVLFLGCTNKKCTNFYSSKNPETRLVEVASEQPVEP